MNKQDINDINDYNDLYELKNYMKNNFDLNINIRIPNGNIDIITINDIYLYLILNIIILILFIIILIKIIKKKYSKIFLILLLLMLLYNLYKIFNCLYSIYLYYNFYDNDYNNKSISYKNIDFSTGDIIQERLPWYSIKGILYYILNKNHKYMHGGIIINFKNKNYILHLLDKNSQNDNMILEFNDHSELEICSLENYMKNNDYHSKYYRLFKVNNKSKINNDKLFNVLKEMDIKKISFKFDLLVPENNNYDDNFSKNYNCINFILKILYKLNIIPLFNFQNMFTSDFVFLPNLSNNIYNKEIYFNT